jgi:Zn-dependent peptidase ImmA (M78 family)
VFYLPKPPTDFAPLRDFRRLPAALEGGISANLAFHIRNAYERRELALELHDDLREAAPGFSLKTKLGDDPEAVGEAIRKFLGVDADAQTQAARQDRAFDFWRRRVEENGILVFVVSGPHYSVELDEMRGFAIARDVLPVIVINGKDYSQGGKCYTLIHELIHILLGESAISNGTDFNSNSEEQKTERFCDAVAAAVLMPRGIMLSFAEVRPTGARKWNDDELRTIGRRLGVSREALLLRLVSLNRATWEFYNTQRGRFKDEYEEAFAPR